MVYLQPIYKKMSDNYNKNLANNIKSVLSEIGENTERDGQILFIDARNIYRQIDRAHRDFTDSQIEFICSENSGSWFIRI